MSVELPFVVNYVNTNLNNKEWVNVLPKQYNFSKIWIKQCVNRTKLPTNQYLYSKTKLDVIQL